MKYFLLFITLLFSGKYASGQKLSNGTYTFRYCDLEYNRCLGPCKVVINNDSITVYATKELSKNITHTREGDIIDQGLILKHQTGTWIVAKDRKDALTKELGFESPARIDFVKRQYWTY